MSGRYLGVGGPGRRVIFPGGGHRVPVRGDLERLPRVPLQGGGGGALTTLTTHTFGQKS